MQILTFSLVPVVLADIQGFKFVIGLFPPVFSGLDRSRSIARLTALRVALSLFEGFIVVYKNGKLTLSGRIELEFGGIHCEFEGFIPPAPISFE